MTFSTVEKATENYISNKAKNLFYYQLILS